MKKFAILLYSIAIAILAGCGLFNGQINEQESKDGTFEIFMLPLENYLEGKVASSACEAAQVPVLSNDDIQSYNLDTHEIRLNQTTAERLSETQLVGQPFVVCADHEAIYTGEFMAAFMSRSSDSVVILWPPMDGDEQVMIIQLGYPGPDFYTGEDPRSDTRILQALEQAGLIDASEDN